MKKILFVVPILIMLLSGCKKKLIELENPTTYNYDTYFDSPERINEAVVATYAVFLHPGMYSRDYYYIFDLLGNDATVVTAPDQDLGEFQNYQFDKTNGNIGRLWAALYRMVLRANIVLDRADALLKKNSLADVEQYIGEARYLRAYAYFQLVTLWGRVPLRKSYQETRANLRPPRADTSEIWKLIREDLQVAIDDLPDRGSEDLGRLTKQAAQALFGKVHLYRGNWNAAITQFTAMVDDYDFDDAYDEEEGIFGQENGANDEIIFQVMHLKFTEPPFYNYFEGDQETSEGQATYTARAWEYGFADEAHVRVTTKLVEAFRYSVKNVPVTDPREYYFIYDASAATEAKSTYCDRCAAMKPFTRAGYWWKKYEYYEDVEELRRAGSGINSVVMRKADVMLMLAEAYIRVGRLMDAKDVINEVRERVDLLDQNLYPPFYYDNASFANQGLAMGILMHERRIELCGEQSRFFDLVRWGLLNDLNNELGGNFVDLIKHKLLPIPQQERSTNPNVAKDINGDWN